MPGRRFMLLYEGHRILLPDGETLVGRSLSCRIRFNDPAVSRKHLRILVSNGRAAVMDLSSNGSIVNGRRMTKAHSLAAGDVLRVGHQYIKVEELEETEPGPLLVTRAAEREDEETKPGDMPRAAAAAAAALAVDEPPDTPRVLSPRSLTSIQVHTCPRCKSRVSYFDESCPRCGHVWPPGHPSHHTQEIAIETMRERRSPRYSIEIPVIYSSATLTIDAIVRDISKGGMFIQTELLDPIGTPCEITALPDGHSALLFTGAVVHVADDLTTGRMSGLGIRFVGGSTEALTWLNETLARYAAAAGVE